MEQEIALNEMGNKLVVNESSQTYLSEIRKWTSFLSILGFISVGLLVLAAIFIGFVFSFLPIPDNGMPFPSVFLTIFYLVFAVLYFFPVYYLYQFSVKMKYALMGKATDMLETSFGFLKSHYRFIGILTIVLLALYPIFIIAFIIFGIMNGFHNQPGFPHVGHAVLSPPFSYGYTDCYSSSAINSSIIAASSSALNASPR